MRGEGQDKSAGPLIRNRASMGNPGSEKRLPVGCHPERSRGICGLLGKHNSPAGEPQIPRLRPLKRAPLGMTILANAPEPR